MAMLIPRPKASEIRLLRQPELGEFDHFDIHKMDSNPGMNPWVQRSVFKPSRECQVVVRWEVGATPWIIPPLEFLPPLTCTVPNKP